MSPPPLRGTESMERERFVSAIEIAVVGLLFMGALWFLAPAVGKEPWLAVAFVAGGAALVLYLGWYSPVRIHGDSLESRGLGPPSRLFVRTDNLRRAVTLYGAITGLAGLAVVLLALRERPDAISGLDGSAAALKFVFYLTSALGQWLIMSFFLLRLGDLVAPEAEGSTGDSDAVAGRRHCVRVAATAAVLFSVSHYPNAALAGYTLGVGFVLFWAFCRVPNLLVVAVSHAVLGTLVHRVWGVSTRIGPFFGDTENYPWREIFPFLGDWVGGRF